MKMIKPIVSVAKVLDDYDTFIIGFRGCLFDGLSVNKDAVTAVLKLKMNGKKIILVSNTPMRMKNVINFLEANNIPSFVWDAVVTSGELVHYKLKSAKSSFALLGKKYYNIGSDINFGVFQGLDYHKVDRICDADFLYMSEAKSLNDIIEDYHTVLDYGISQSLPLLCVGNDSASYLDGTVSIAPGSIAEQYAVMGGQIITVGKPSPEVLLYAVDNFKNFEKSRTILIGDSLSTDIKGANLIGVDSILISKGIHVNFMGEGYIPDITKAKELAANFETYPNYVTSNLRW